MKLIQSGNEFSIANITSTPERLPAGNYLLKFHPQKGFYLVKKEDFKLPAKMYGDHHEIDRWLASYDKNSEKNMGIILSGIKGTGKTITAHMLCQKANKPVIMINDPFGGGDFVDFLTDPLFNDSIIFVDEFEKIYSKQQEGKSPIDFLSTMDGNYNTRLLFLLTVNEMSISEYLVNRPGRLKYRKVYDNLPHDIIDAVVDDLLDNKKHKESVFRFFEALGIVTYDLLVCIIKDMNLFKQDAIECGRYLNLKAETVIYNVAELKDGKSVDCMDMAFSIAMETVGIQRITYFQGTPEKDYGDQEDSYVPITVNKCDIKKTGIDMITIVTPEKYHFRLTRKPKFYYMF